ncbi:unnamed protein product [Kuraishia capsulata CBS 1993]|uniref:Choline monooxygenase, chloroplastic n=1 Tax=Kuraishia capsulata CBS 1993 TaxID=1382522 RepID=W6MRI3_9ASCO|nr:uncharacterized protein KUCA_T00000407001 [Kuraishia capsulata CBS 1993]CDK24445.1 unnamed protein product [Kuraishia capsulata CBS 1993]
MTLPVTLPASWYTSDELLGIAKKKIFNKGWHFISPITKFTRDQEDGQRFCQLDLLENPFFIENSIEDVYQVNSVEAYYGKHKCLFTGHETDSQVEHVLSTLARASTHVTKSGLLFVCHESSPPDFNAFFGNQLDQFIEGKDFRSIAHRRKLSYECDYGFLTFIDGYQECLHCAYTHPGLAKAYCMDFYKVETYTNFCRHLADSNEKAGEDDTEAPDPGLFIYFFPTCALNFYAGGMGVFRCCPLTGSKCRMEFDYFFDGSDEDFEKYYEFARQVAIEDIELCEACQKNLESGIYQVGTLNPDKEKGVVYYQKLIREKIMV